ncbi:hypothetical protein MNBD_GAMMA09-1549, partial [hydrothermal vent metagenome]
KYPSLLQFDTALNKGIIQDNLQSLYGIKQAPCDTYLRERLDEVEPKHLRKSYSQLFSILQRGKGLEGFSYIDDHYLLSIDGTGYFSSSEVRCDQCCEKHHRDGHTTYYHQLLGAVLVHPDHREVFPLAPEPILKQDGASKNDCERNAAKRLLEDTRREHPHLKFIVVEDGLASNAPHIKQLKKLNYRFILGAKAKDHTFLFDWVDKTAATSEIEFTDKQGIKHRFRYLNNAPLNGSNIDLEINFLEYWETKPSGKTQHFSWVTDLPLCETNLMQIMRGARARWKIENETFNTLKNHGYYFEHNFGHGYQHLSTVMVHLMMLAFLIDQIQQRCCGLFNRAMEKEGTQSNFWEQLRSLFKCYLIPDWEALYLGIANELKPTVIPYNTT